MKVTPLPGAAILKPPAEVPPTPPPPPPRIGWKYADGIAPEGQCYRVHEWHRELPHGTLILMIVLRHGDAEASSSIAFVPHAKPSEEPYR